MNTNIPLLPAPRIAGLLPPPRVNIAEVLPQLLPGDGGFWGAVTQTLGRVGIAEEMIETRIRRHPDKAALLWDSFMLCIPVAGMHNYPDFVWEHHAEELLNRVVNDEPLTPPTEAEMVIQLMGIAQQTPMRHAPTMLAIRLTQSVLGRAKEAKTFDAMVEEVGLQEGYKGEVESCRQEMSDYMARRITRHTPDPTRWAERVPTHRKIEIMGTRNYNRYEGGV